MTVAVASAIAGVDAGALLLLRCLPSSFSRLDKSAKIISNQNASASKSMATDM